MQSRVFEGQPASHERETAKRRQRRDSRWPREDGLVSYSGMQGIPGGRGILGGASPERTGRRDSYLPSPSPAGRGPPCVTQKATVTSPWKADQGLRVHRRLSTSGQGTEGRVREALECSWPCTHLQAKELLGREKLGPEGSSDHHQRGKELSDPTTRARTKAHCAPPPEPQVPCCPGLPVLSTPASHSASSPAGQLSSEGPPVPTQKELWVPPSSGERCALTLTLTLGLHRLPLLNLRPSQRRWGGS